MSGGRNGKRQLAKNKTSEDDEYDVGVKQMGHEKGYFVSETEKFMLAESKIIIDALQAANFVTREKTDNLVMKVVDLDADQRDRILMTSVVCFNNRKHTNEDGECVYRKDRDRYIVEPMTLIFNEDNYYLMCYSSNQRALIDNLIEYRSFDEMIGGDIDIDNIRLSLKRNMVIIQLYPKMYGKVRSGG